jgi:hypothetical protein
VVYDRPATNYACEEADPVLLGEKGVKIALAADLAAGEGIE